MIFYKCYTALNGIQIVQLSSVFNNVIFYRESVIDHNWSFFRPKTTNDEVFFSKQNGICKKSRCIL